MGCLFLSLTRELGRGRVERELGGRDASKTVFRTDAKRKEGTVTQKSEIYFTRAIRFSDEVTDSTSPLVRNYRGKRCEVNESTALPRSFEGEFGRVELVSPRPPSVLKAEESLRRYGLSPLVGSQTSLSVLQDAKLSRLRFFAKAVPSGDVLLFLALLQPLGCLARTSHSSRPRRITLGR